MKYILCFTFLTFFFPLYCQSNINSLAIDDTEPFLYIPLLYPNTNIAKGSLVVHASIGHMPYSKNVNDYFNPLIIGGATMSLDAFYPNKFAFSLFIMGSSGELKKNISLDNGKNWGIGDFINFESYGLSAGYSIWDNLRWRFTSWGGITLSKSDIKTLSNSETTKIGSNLSPLIGVNLSRRFINPEKFKPFRGAGMCGGVNLRISYIPFVIQKKQLPFSGGIWYLTFGVNLEMFERY